MFGRLIKVLARKNQFRFLFKVPKIIIFAFLFYVRIPLRVLRFDTPLLYFSLFRRMSLDTSIHIDADASHATPLAVKALWMFVATFLLQ